MSGRAYVVQILIGIVLVVVLLLYISSRTGLENGEFLVKDREGDRMRIQVSLDMHEAIDALMLMHKNGEGRWVGGELEDSDNEYGFRFDPDTIIVAQFTAEALQAGSFNVIASNLSYWRGLGVVYIWGNVVGAPK